MASVPANRQQLETERSLAESRIEREGIKPGTRAPGFTLPDLSGGTVSLADYRGRRVLLVFSDPNCGPCEALAPDLVALQRANPALDLVMVSRGDLEANRSKARGFNFPVALQDGWNVSKQYGMFATPIAFLIDRHGVVEKPVAVGAAQILALVETPKPENEIVPRRGALWPIAAAFAGGIIASASRVVAQPTCPTGQVNCAGKCVNPANDPQNCGACGRACPSGSICVNGACVVTCGAGQTNCGGFCANLGSDPHNCGRCGFSCGDGMVCVNGVCSCPTGFVRCGNACVLVSVDPKNCGACGHQCPEGSHCVDGACVSPPCPTGMVKCAGGTCANLATDPSNCGACGKQCPPGYTCVQGVCTAPPCPRGQTNCAGTCTNLAYDPNNCGSCGKKCPAGSVCYNGRCVKICA